MTETRRRGLGRGLSALMSDLEPEGTTPKAPDLTVPIETIAPNPDQPRKAFGQDELTELSESIRRYGILQPILVRPAGQGYQIVAGERRWRAAQLASLHEVPIIVRDLDDQDTLEVALIENIQRSDLDPIEEARGYHLLIDRFGHTQEALGSQLGKSRSHIANTLRLLTLPEGVQDMLMRGEITAGHARTLVNHDDADALARRIADDNLTVREAEALAKGRDPDERPKAPERDADTRALEGDLSAALGLPVRINHGAKGGGKVVLTYPDLDALDALIARLGVR